jgi:PilZ domain.
MVYWLDQRRSRMRFPLAIQGQITLGQPLKFVSCIVTDLSDTGARITLSEPADVPPEFDLIIPERLNIKASIAWREGHEYGIRFLAERSQDHEALSGFDASDDCPASIPDTANPSLTEQPMVQKALDEARDRIASAIGVPAGSIKLMIEIAP